ncbi:unnamed protein product [Brassicogethes aeneus]|uniref:Potassium channel domain-containing protein n=1 Tax=Brassicogethes aeneus TaxID=1431903 RepID=A0A9P0FL14_BRAAE|nr:unnamed protein product [Brassicogethes aeneus]
MSRKQWFLLLCLFSIYLLMGASIFYVIESKEEFLRMERENEERREIEGLIKHYYPDGDKKFLDRLATYCEKPLAVDMSREKSEEKWDFYHSLFFVITVVSTIGYGNLAPTTMLSRIIMIFYALIGIPINGIVMISLGSYFGSKFEKLYHRWKSAKMQYDSTKLGLVSQIFLYLIPGFVFFIFLPSLIMVMFEGWNYDVAVYYAFVTLTTIGFGDFVSGVKNEYHVNDIWYMTYKIFLLFWVIGGIGYVLMVINFITRGMMSKKIVKLEHIITENIKKTPQRIRQELRTLLHEFLLVKVKPVYKGEFLYEPHVLERSQSCPDLSMFDSAESISCVRQRAFSVGFREIKPRHSFQSESELDKIDKERTFRPSDALLKQNHLLLKVVDALGHKSGKYGLDLFSDRDILASENISSNASSDMNLHDARRRALSDTTPPLGINIDFEKNNGHTWYGDDAKYKLKEFRERTCSMPQQRPRTNSSIFRKIRDRIMNQTKTVDVEKQAEDYPQKPKDVPNINLLDESFLRPIGLLDEQDNYLKQTRRGRYSMFAGPQENYVRQTRAGRRSIADYQDAVLEQTSIADFLRALTAVSVPETLGPNLKRRKMGTASITPPEIATPSRTRRMPIRAQYQNRRASLMPSQTTNKLPPRRFSLRPVDENLSTSPPPYSITVNEGRRSIRSRNRRFSIRPTTMAFGNSTGPVQRQCTVLKKDKTESGEKADKQ